MLLVMNILCLKLSLLLTVCLLKILLVVNINPLLRTQFTTCLGLAFADTGGRIHITQYSVQYSIVNSVHTTSYNGVLRDQEYCVYCVLIG